MAVQIPEENRSFDLIASYIYETPPAENLELSTMCRDGYARGDMIESLIHIPDCTNEFIFIDPVFTDPPYLDIIDISDGSLNGSSIAISYEERNKASLISQTNYLNEGGTYEFIKKYKIVPYNIYSYLGTLSYSLDFLQTPPTYDSGDASYGTIGKYSIYQRYSGDVLKEGVTVTITNTVYKNSVVVDTNTTTFNTQDLDTVKLDDEEGAATEYYNNGIYNYYLYSLGITSFEDEIYIEQKYTITYDNITALRWWWDYSMSIDGYHRYFRFNCDPQISMQFIQYKQSEEESYVDAESGFIHNNYSQYNNWNKERPGVQSPTARINVFPGTSETYLFYSDYYDEITMRVDWVL